MKNFNRFLNFKLTLILGIIVLLFFAHSLKAVVSSTVTKHNTLNCNPCDQSHIPLIDPTDHLYYIKGNLNILNDIPGNQTGLIFVDQDLLINPGSGKLMQPPPVNPNSGLVFIVKGNVNIHQDVTRIDAVIITEGTICTAYDGTSCPSGFTDPAITSPLVINGSLISLNPDQPVQFKRTLTDNAEPAEVINHQVKYLVILRNLLSDTLQKWSEVRGP